MEPWNFEGDQFGILKDSDWNVVDVGIDCEWIRLVVLLYGVAAVVVNDDDDCVLLHGGRLAQKNQKSRPGGNCWLTVL